MQNRRLAILVAFVLLASLPWYALGGQEDPKYDHFRGEMLPKVGQKITFQGTIRPGKFGPYITPDEWVGIYIECTTTNAADLAKLNKVNRQQGRTIKVQGVVYLARERPSREIKGVQVSGIPEHFFFDVAEISFSESKLRPNAKTTKN